MEKVCRPERTADLIAESLIGQIRSGDVVPDTPLPTERELCDRFGASRPTVRQALVQMQMRGYARAGAGRRPRANRPLLGDVLRGAGQHIREILGDAESDAHLEQMRQFIETGAAREAAIRASHVQIARIRAALEANFRAIGTGRFPASDVAFHRALVSVVGNPVILTLHDMFVSELLHRRPGAADQAARDRLSCKEHSAVYQAILGGEPIAATRILDDHLTRSFRSRLPPPQPPANGSTREHPAPPTGGQEPGQ